MNLINKINNFNNVAKIRMKEHGEPGVWLVWNNWYTIVGGKQVFHAENDIREGMDVEDIIDDDIFNWPDPIMTTKELKEAVLY